MTPSPFVLRGACGGGFWVAGGHVTPASERRSEERADTLFPLKGTDCIPSDGGSQRRTRAKRAARQRRVSGAQPAAVVGHTRARERGRGQAVTGEAGGAAALGYNCVSFPVFPY